MDLDFDDPPARRRRRALRRALLVAGVVLAIWGLSRVNLHFPGFAIRHRPNASDEPVPTWDERFPRVDLVEGLLEPPIHIEKVLHSTRLLATGTLADGTPVLFRGGDGECDALGPSLETLTTLETERPVRDVVSVPTPDGGPRFVAVDDRRDTVARGDRVVGLDVRGATTWRWEPTEGYVHSIALLHDERGASGVVVAAGGAQGLVALDLRGRPIWDVPKRHVAYEVRTHPSLPGFVLLLSGDFSLFEGAGVERLTSRAHGSDARLSHVQEWSATGVLLPDAHGLPCLIVGGKALGSDDPLLVRLDVLDHEAWRARPATEVRRLQLVEPPGHARLVVAVTEDGDLLVVDEDGTLRARARLPGAVSGRRLFLYGLAAGRLGRDGFCVAVDLRDGTHVYRLHPERLPAR